MDHVHDERRRAFLRGGAVVVEIRPPWALDLTEFFEKCTCCRQCLEACPEGILTMDGFGYPRVDFSKGGCSFCGTCVESCLEAALVKGNNEPWSYRAHIAVSCLNRRGTLCRTCGEECEIRAISYPAQNTGFASPLLDWKRCTGCGACLRGCPVQAITLVML